MQMLLLFLLLHLFTNANANVRVSSDLNCSFDPHSRCLWQNDTQLGTVGFIVVSDVALTDLRFPITDAPNENFFAHTVGPPGFMGQTSLLSDIVECQLGGAKLKFLHFHTGPRTRVEVCIRSPPGSPLPSNLHCYQPPGSVLPRQWLTATVELPPMTQPIELLIRATFESPISLVAIDKIVYEAILCETSHRGTAEGAGGPIDGGNGNVVKSPQQQWQDQQQRFPFGFDGHQIQQSRGIAGGFTEKGAFGNSLTELGDFSEDNFLARKEKVDGAKTALDGKFDCNFGKTNFCIYQNALVLANLSSVPSIRNWSLENRPIANPLTGIQNDHSGEGWFIYAGANADPEALYLLESSQPLPESHRPLVLHFHYHMAGARGRLRVCFGNSTKGLVPLLLDSANSTIGENGQADSLCPFLREGMAELSELPAEVDPRAWRKAAVSVPLDSNKIFFLAYQLPKNYFIGLDSIKLLEGTGAEFNFEEY